MRTIEKDTAMNAATVHYDLDSRELPLMPAGRRCKIPGCTTILSRYNTNEVCNACQRHARNAGQKIPRALLDSSKGGLRALRQRRASTQLSEQEELLARELVEILSGLLETTAAELCIGGARPRRNVARGRKLGAYILKKHFRWNGTHIAGVFWRGAYFMVYDTVKRAEDEMSAGNAFMRKAVDEVLRQLASCGHAPPSPS
jgi:hypothetical protein